MRKLFWFLWNERKGASVSRNDRYTVSIPAVPTDPGVVRSDTDPGRSGDDRSVLSADPYPRELLRL